MKWDILLERIYLGAYHAAYNAVCDEAVLRIAVVYCNSKGTSLDGQFSSSLSIGKQTDLGLTTV